MQPMHPFVKQTVTLSLAVTLAKVTPIDRRNRDDSTVLVSTSAVYGSAFL